MTENDEDHCGSTLQLRRYQLEMLEKSMQRNIIIAMDTGSGKTFIAASRIKAELEVCPIDKYAWFLVPTVALAIQQHKVLSENIPDVQARMLSGADGVDHWGKQSMWDDVLKNIRIVVSTHQVLLDALVHGFVQMKRLAVLVFDEAHHCQGSHPYNRIMRDFYHAHPVDGLNQVPAVLGLTASPIMNNKAGQLQELERNLNAIAVTPKLHRDEMLQFVHQPHLIRLSYPPESPGTPHCQALLDLAHMYTNLDIMKDPYVVQLMDSSNANNSTELRKILLSKKTYCQDLIKGFYNKAKSIHTELGSWATNYYVDSCIKKFERGVNKRNSDLDTLNSAEKSYLMKIFARIKVSTDLDQLLEDDSHFSSKLLTLISYLAKVKSDDFTGLIFVQTRAAVAAIAHIISLHPRTIGVFSVSTFVGASTHFGRKFSIGELLDIKNQKTTLDDLREGKKNLIVTTSALEEGIDVSACNNVICFEKPSNVKSFIQRRGRARKSTSKFAMMFEEKSDLTTISMWRELENEMKKVYMDDTRRLEELRNLEEKEEENRVFKVESTGAKITLEDAVQHLYHFCATLPATRYVDLRPVFQFSEIGEQDDVKSISSKVSLPNSVDEAVREAHSKFSWTTERFARKDAAFEAYIALHQEGLVNDHLLPQKFENEAVEKRQSFTEVPAQLDFWSEFVAHEWQLQLPLYHASVKIWQEGAVNAHMIMILPRPVPCSISFELYWDNKTTLQCAIEPSYYEPYSHEHINTYAQVTRLILLSVYQTQMKNDLADLSCLFVPAGVDDLKLWQEKSMGRTSVLPFSHLNTNELEVGIIRDLTRSGAPYVLHSIEPFQINQWDVDFGFKSPSDGDNLEDTLCLKVRRLSKRADFLHQISHHNQAAASEAGFSYLSPQRCEFDKLPIRYARFALLIPSIMHQLEIYNLAEHLRSNLLAPIQIQNLKLVITATNASGARESTDYQRLEFLGDSILKFLTSLNLTATHLNWHEGLLSGKKDHLVSNATLALSAVNTGLAKYIRTVPFTGRKWRPLYNSNLVKKQLRTPRDISTKILADVVEALIGASYIDGGQEKATACLTVFIPEISWVSSSQHHEVLYNFYDHDNRYPPHFTQVEHLIEHKFNLKSLLVEALTHPSHNGPNTCASYQRLEFLGDSILDNIVVNIVHNHQSQLPTPILHLMRTTLVNASFLAFLCLTLSKPITRSEPISDQDQNFSTIQTTTNLHIWQFMRHAAPMVRTAQQACLTRYNSLRNAISYALTYGRTYPWALLARLDAPKFFSDIIESLLGAIYVDTHGSATACQAFLEVLGLMPYLRRVINGEIALLHPKEELGQLANNKKVTYVRDGDDVAEDQDLDSRRLTCSVLVDERKIVTVSDGISVMEVETRAAAEAIRVLMAEAGGEAGETVGGGENKDNEDADEGEEEGEKMDEEEDE